MSGSGRQCSREGCSRLWEVRVEFHDGRGDEFTCEDHAYELVDTGEVKSISGAWGPTADDVQEAVRDPLAAFRRRAG